MSYYYEHLYGPNKNEAYINILAPTCKLFNLLYHGNDRYLAAGYDLHILKKVSTAC
jgi:hypothetical protein